MKSIYGGGEAVREAMEEMFEGGPISGIPDSGVNGEERGLSLCRSLPALEELIRACVEHPRGGR